MSARRPPKVVAFGGGHGLSATLSALRTVTPDLTAVVTVADDGGSSGVIRSELGTLPPGDLRMALTALAGEDEQSQLWAQLCRHRFGGGATLDGHPVGNLILTGLEELTGDTVAALDAVGRLLGAAGRVLPLSVEPLEIIADVAGLDPADATRPVEVRGQVAVATTPGDVLSVRIDPPYASACPEAVEAVMAADWVILGPGSWFTSVIPHLLVSDMAKALSMTPARRLVVLNLSSHDAETEGFSPATHLEVLAAHAPRIELDVVLAGRRSVAEGSEALEAAAKSLGAELVVRQLGDDSGRPMHDPQRLAAAYSTILTTTDEGDAQWR
jgi:uncharacterized cofD-like protein